MPRRKKPTIEEPPTLRLPPENPKAKMWLWIGVSVITAIILVMWGWAMSINISSFNWAKTPEKKLIDSSQNNWNELFNNEQTRIKNEEIKRQIKNILNIISTQGNTTTASSTINATASSTISTTTTASTSTAH